MKVVLGPRWLASGKLLPMLTLQFWVCCCMLDVSNKLTNFTTAVVAYDFLLTFPDEIRIMWKCPVTGSKILFIANRYLYLLFATVRIGSDVAVGLSNQVGPICAHHEDSFICTQRYALHLDEMMNLFEASVMTHIQLLTYPTLELCFGCTSQSRRQW